MPKWELARCGDIEERKWWKEIEPFFPNYERFWAEHIVPLTFRVLDPDIILLRPGTPAYLRDLASASYAVFWNLASSHVILESQGVLADRRKLYAFYSHLYSVFEAVRLFHSAIKKVHRHYNLTYITTYACWLDRWLGRYGDTSLTQDYKRVRHVISQGYRGCSVHSYGTIMINGMVPKPEKVKGYSDLSSLAKIWIDPYKHQILANDFVEIESQCKSDVQRVGQVLNRVWDVVLQDFDVVSAVSQYLHDRSLVTSEDQRFVQLATAMRQAENHDWASWEASGPTVFGE